MISDLEKKVSKEEDKRIMERVKGLSAKEKLAYFGGYADAILYTNKLTSEVYQYMINNNGE